MLDYNQTEWAILVIAVGEYIHKRTDPVCELDFRDPALLAQAEALKHKLRQGGDSWSTIDNGSLRSIAASIDPPLTAYAGHIIVER